MAYEKSATGFLEQTKRIDAHSHQLLISRNEIVSEMKKLEEKLASKESEIAERVCPFRIGQTVEIRNKKLVGPKSTRYVIVGLTFTEVPPLYEIWVRREDRMQNYFVYGEIVKIDNPSLMIGCMDLDEENRVLVEKKKAVLEEQGLIPNFHLVKNHTSNLIED
jgi:hypothetical protein